MENRLSRWGVGPKTFFPSLIYFSASMAATYTWPHVFVLHWLPGFVRLAGLAMTVAGVLIWITGVITVMRAYNRDELVTTGVFAIVRHPVYAGWITLGFPGLAVFAASWPMLLTPVIAYSIFRRLIHREDEYLERRFGQPYLDYRRRVNEVIPIPRFWE